MVNRPELKIDGAIYTLPINPVEYSNKTGELYSVTPTVDGNSLRYSSFWDGRERVMVWAEVPNTSLFQELVSMLRSAVRKPDVYLNHKGLGLRNTSFWKEIFIHTVDISLSSKASSRATNKLVYDITMKFSYVKPKYLKALFTYQPDDYLNDGFQSMKAENFDMIVAHPGLGILNWIGLREAFPTSVILMYWNIQELNIGNGRISYPANGFYQAHTNAAMTVSGRFMRTNMSGSLHALPAIATAAASECIITKEVALAVTPIISGNMKGLYNNISGRFHFDGVYIDMCTPEWPSWKWAVLSNWIASGFTVDWNGDAVHDSSFSNLMTQYAQGTAWTISGLRTAVDANKFILANTGGAYFHPELNGITIENVGDRFSFAEADTCYYGQDAVRVRGQNMHVAWAINAVSSGLIKNYCAARPTVAYGFNRSRYIV